jgi:RNA polymerase sigma factor (sigma-70 family)
VTSSHQTAPPNEPAAPAAFVTTHWSAVLRAGYGSTSEARAALEELCCAYWYPVYAYVRRRGHLPEDAKDLTQSFFLRLLSQKSFAHADPKLGRFRSFILGALDHFLVSEWKRVNAEKRGGGRAILSLDWAAAENRFDLEPADTTTPDKIFDKQWATALLDKVLAELEKEYVAEKDLFQTLKQTLAGRRETQPYAELAKRLGMSEGAIRVAVHRLRKRYRALLQAEIGRTVSSPEEAKEELAYLFKSLSQ